MQIDTQEPSPSPRETALLTTGELRAQFLLEDLFQPGDLVLRVTDLDRAIVGAACPTDEPLELGAVELLRTASFLDRREVGILNLGGAGSVSVGEETYALGPLECLYAGRGAGDLCFRSADADAPALFYLVSYPAHQAHPTAKATAAEANVLHLGSPTDANERTLYQFICEGRIASCQLVMGYTEIQPGSVWNTMPPHTHARRSEIYTYFDVPAGHAVLHLMGDPSETRSLWVGNLQTVLSPSWSIHSGAGTQAYKFIWAMGGENQAFADMDGAPIETLR